MEYAKCLVELNEVINHLEEECLKKIPDEIRRGIAEQMDKNYSWSYDESKELNKQNIERETIAMLAYLNTEYLLNDEQRKFMEEYHKLNEKKRKNQWNYNIFSD